MNKLTILARGKDKTGHWIIGSYFPSIISLASPFDGIENSYKHYIICNGAVIGGFPALWIYMKFVKNQ